VGHHQVAGTRETGEGESETRGFAPTPPEWTYFYLYVILDSFSRYVVGWMVGHRETAELAQDCIGATAAKQAIDPDTLTLHADLGSSMTSKPVAFLLADLGITQSHSRPHVSNDNPFSESQCKTLKYRPTFLTRFASIEAAHGFCQAFFAWYNTQHRHSGIGLHTPEALHHGFATARHAAGEQPCRRRLPRSQNASCANRRRQRCRPQRGSISPLCRLVRRLW